MDTVSVSIRVRPLNHREIQNEAASSLLTENRNIVMLDDNNRPIPSAAFAFGTPSRLDD